MAEIARKTQVISGVTPDRIPVAELLEAGQPAILKGLVRDWPLVAVVSNRPSTPSPI